MKAILRLGLATLVVSFVATLGLNYYLAPEGRGKITTTSAGQDSSQQLTQTELREQIEGLKIEIDRLEDRIDRTRGQHSLAQARTRTLIKELKRYEAERDDFFSAHRQRKAQIETRLEELDRAIEAQVAERNRRQARTSDQDARYRVDSMLAYAHPLNQSPELNDYLRNAPKANLELVQRRFELMMQPPDYAYQERLYNQLEEVLETLAGEHGHDPEIVALYCSDDNCELQLSMAQPKPFYDYWREALERIRTNTDLQILEAQLTTETDARLFGLIMTRRLE